MKKTLFFCSLITIIGFSQLGFATSESAPYETKTIETELVDSSQKATSTATIGFSEQKQTDQSNKTISKGRLPTTGESMGIGLSLLGLIVIIIIFRKELKEMVKNRGKIK